MIRQTKSSFYPMPAMGFSAHADVEEIWDEFAAPDLHLLFPVKYYSLRQ